MSRLSFTYVEDDASNRLGNSHATVDAGGIHALARLYLSGEQMTEFAEQLKTFPIPIEGVEFEDGGYRIWVGSEGSRGHLRVTMTVRTQTFTHGLHEHEASIMFTADYASIETFARALVRTFGGDGSEAVLVGISD